MNEKTFSEIGDETITFHDLYNRCTSLLFAVFDPTCTGSLSTEERNGMADGVLAVLGAVYHDLTGKDVAPFIPWAKERMIEFITLQAAKEAGLLN